MRQGLKRIIDKVGVTSILVTHDQEEAFDLADQVVIFNRCPAPACFTDSVLDACSSGGALLP